MAARWQLKVLALALTIMATAGTHVNFARFSSTGTSRAVVHDIGYQYEVLQYIWRKYHAPILRAVSHITDDADEVAAGLYCALWYTHECRCWASTLTLT